MTARRRTAAPAPILPTLSRAQSRWLETCAYCPTLCLFTCPVSNAEGRDTVAPWGKMSLVRWLSLEKMPLDEQSASILYKCLGCLACRTPCRHDVEVPTVLFAARAEAVARGVAPFTAENFRPDPTALTRGLADGAPGERYLNEAQALLLPGAEGLVHAPETIRDTFAVADALGLDYLAVGAASALDSGYGAWCAGYLDEARKAAVRLMRATSRYRKLVVSSPHTLYMLRVVYPQLGVEGIRPAQYLGELLAASLAGRSVPRLVEGRVCYHDPCYLGRHLALFEAPRAILRAICAEPLVELRDHRDSARCCGGGGGVDVTSPAVATHAARAVIEGARRRDADVLATACGTCRRLLGEAAGSDGPVVEDVVTLLARALRT